MKPFTKVAELKVSYQPETGWEEQPIISSSRDAYDFLYSFFPQETIALQEHFIVAYLNRANRVIGVYHTSTGGVTGTVADPRLILGTALKVVASGIILAHNHPSGNIYPSTNDIELTRKIKEGGQLMDITLHDHLIVTPAKDRYYGFADEGRL
jgi:DNA repair protein RadC